jgi:hypothetical protein
MSLRPGRGLCFEAARRWRALSGDEIDALVFASMLAS